MKLDDISWMPRDEAEAIVRANNLIGINGKKPVGIGLHPFDHHFACVLASRPDFDPVPVYSGVFVWMFCAEAFEDC